MCVFARECVCVCVSVCVFSVRLSWDGAVYPVLIRSRVVVIKQYRVSSKSI